MKRGVYFTPGNEVNTKRITFGIPSKGNGKIETEGLLKECKLAANFGDEADFRSLDRDIEFLPERQLDIARDIGAYRLDLGIVGEDMIAEADCPVEVISKLNYNKCRVSFIAPPGFGISKSLRIATKLPNITKKFVAEMGWSSYTTIIEREGALEIALKQDLADAIIDQIATGKTIASFGFEEEYTLMESQFVLVSNKASLETKGSEIERVKTMIEGVIAARNKNLVVFNIPNKNLESLIKELPTCKSPTINKLANKAWSAVSTVVSDELLCKTIDKIRRNSGEDILVTPISVYLTEQKQKQTIEELYGKILERKMNPVIFSRTTRYLRDSNKLAEKFLGECKELVEAISKGQKEGKDGIIWEAADSLYFFLAMAAASSEYIKLNLKNEWCLEEVEKTFIDVSKELASLFKIRETIVKYNGGSCEPDLWIDCKENARQLEICLNDWMVMWGFLLKENGVSEEAVELENGRRDKG